MDFYDRQHRSRATTDRADAPVSSGADTASGAADVDAPPAVSGIPAAARGVTLTPDTIIGFCGALLVTIGSFGPWAKIGAGTATGLSGDGAFSVVAGFILLGLVALGRWPGLSAAAALVAGSVGLYDAVALGSTPDLEELISVSIGWGVILTAAGGILGLGWALYRVALDNATAALIAGLLSVLVLICAVALGNGASVSSVKFSNGTEYTENVAPDETFPYTD